MGRGISNGGGQSSLGYLFGSGETTNNAPAAKNQEQDANNRLPQKSTTAVQPVDNSKQIPAGIQGNLANNYQRADGQNTGNFITVEPLKFKDGKEAILILLFMHFFSVLISWILLHDRPSTKVHAAPGGGSSLGYLFGGGGN